MPIPYSAEQTWLLADNLAQSGGFKDWRAVEHELIDRDHDRAAWLLNNSAIRTRLDRMCDKARAIPN